MLGCLLALLLSGAGSELSIQPADDPLQVTVVAQLPRDNPLAGRTGSISPTEGQPILSLSILDGDRVGPPITGRYTLQGATFRYTPKRKLSAGGRYQATLSLPGATPITQAYATPKIDAPAPRVVRVYPTGDVLPANQLKFYLEFSESMREGRAIFDRIHILDAAGEPVEDPWRRKELWTVDGRQLSLWIHPGRIKTGVNLNEEIGPVLAPNQQYTLVIDAEVCSAQGAPLGKPFRKTFKTAPADHTRPLPVEWKVGPVAAGSTDPLHVAFGEPLDQSLASRLIEVFDHQGNPVAGRIELIKGETEWRFHPSAAWKPQAYTLHADGLLEDLAGNTPIRVFDTDLTLPPLKPPQLDLSFTPK